MALETKQDGVHEGCEVQRGMTWGHGQSPNRAQPSSDERGVCLRRAGRRQALRTSVATAGFWERADDAETMQRRGGDDEACHGAHPGAAVICRHGSQLASLPPNGDGPICSSSSPIIQGLACSWPGRLRILRICHPKPLILGPATSCRKPQRRWRCAFWSSHLCDARAASRPLTCAACCWIPGSPSVPCLFHRKHLNLAISFVDRLG